MITHRGSVLSIQFKFPWWWKLYIVALVFSQQCGVLEVDVNKAIEFVLTHSKYRVLGAGKKDARWQYIEVGQRVPGAHRFIVGE